MQDARRTLMAVHAHPDDEAIATGGVLARYAAEGVRTVLVTCTRGEVGEIVDPSVAQPDNLAEVRERELRAACAILGVSALHWLGYRDSGMMGTPDNAHPDAFWQADLDEATGRLVALMRRYRPDVVVTYNANGFYGHPDHIQAHRVTTAAFAVAGDPARYPEPGLAPWQPRKLYHTAVSREGLVEFARLARAAGVELPFAEGDELDWLTPATEITTTVDVRAFADTKRAALAAHRSQVGPETFFLMLPPELWTLAFGVEEFVLATSHVPVRLPETDLFAGLPPL